jgi:glycosyltransferase involved in cell wall biosynthesis
VRVVIEYANRLAVRGHTIYIVAPGGTLAKEIADVINANLHIYETKIKLLSSQNIFSNVRLLWDLTRLVPKVDATIATHTPTTLVNLLAGKVLKKGTPIWFYQDYPGMFQGRTIESLLLRHALTWHVGALTISEFSKNELEGFNAKRKIFLVGEGISRSNLLKPIPAETREAIKQPCPTIFYLGDMRPRKGMQDFLQAIELVRKQIPQIYVWIASKETCQIELNTPYQFFERPDDELLAKLYGSCDIFVSASWWEGFGLPPLEAMACGAPVVTTDSQGVRDYARDGENCLLVPPHDPSALAAAVLRLIADPKLAQRLRENGPKTAANFTWDSAVDRFESALCMLIKERV